MDWNDVITRQNYFTNKEKTLIQKEGLAMGAPSSGLIAEFFLQRLEHQHLAHLSTKHRVMNYFRYVDDILLIYDANHTDIQNILNDFNALHPKMRFTVKTETQQNKLPGRNHPQDTQKLENIHIRNITHRVYRQ
jgi:hypothetical protein